MSGNNNIPRGSSELCRSPTNTNNMETEIHIPSTTTKNDNMFDVFLQRFDKLDRNTNSINTKLDSIGNRISVLEVDVSEVKSTQVSLQLQQDNLKQDQLLLQDNQEEQGKDIYALQGEVSYLLETTERLKRQNNIILHGVAEDSKAEDTVGRIMNILCPRNTLPLRDFRIGTIQANRIRPLRMRLGNVNEVDAALKRSFHLKNKSEYSGIYVTRDLTSMQQMESKKRREAYKQQKEEEEKQSQAQLNLQGQSTHTHTTTTLTVDSTNPAAHSTHNITRNDTHSSYTLPSGIKRSFRAMDTETPQPANESLHTFIKRNRGFTHEPSPDIATITTNNTLPR